MVNIMKNNELVKNNEMIRVSTFIGYKGKKYELVKFVDSISNKIVYGAVKDEYITDGKLNRQLNGLQMRMNDSLQDVVEALQFDTAIEEIRDKRGVDLNTAFEIYLDRHADEIK